MNEAQFRSDAQVFLKRLFEALDLRGIQLEHHWNLDHLCYRVSSLEDYNKYKEYLHAFGEFLVESNVNGRPIATYKLSHPISFQHWQIYLVELPAPKAGKKTIDGFEHAEVVCDISFEEIKKRFSAESFDESGTKKDINPELELMLDDIALKFHHDTLESIIAHEKSLLNS
jgi:predicted metalloenzyme YecM